MMPDIRSTCKPCICGSEVCREMSTVFRIIGDPRCEYVELPPHHLNSNYSFSNKLNGLRAAYLKHLCPDLCVKNNHNDDDDDDDRSITLNGQLQKKYVAVHHFHPEMVQDFAEAGYGQQFRVPLTITQRDADSLEINPDAADRVLSDDSQKPTDEYYFVPSYPLEKVRKDLENILYSSDNVLHNSTSSMTLEVAKSVFHPTIKVDCRSRFRPIRVADHDVNKSQEEDEDNNFAKVQPLRPLNFPPPPPFERSMSPRPCPYQRDLMVSDQFSESDFTESSATSATDNAEEPPPVIENLRFLRQGGKLTRGDSREASYRSLASNASRDASMRGSTSSWRTGGDQPKPPLSPKLLRRGSMASSKRSSICSLRKPGEQPLSPKFFRPEAVWKASTQGGDAISNSLIVPTLINISDEDIDNMSAVSELSNETNTERTVGKPEKGHKRAPEDTTSTRSIDIGQQTSATESNDKNNTTKNDTEKNDKDEIIQTNASSQNNNQDHTTNNALTSKSFKHPTIKRGRSSIYKHSSVENNNVNNPPSSMHERRTLTRNLIHREAFFQLEEEDNEIGATKDLTAVHHANAKSPTRSPCRRRQLPTKEQCKSLRALQKLMSGGPSRRNLPPRSESTSEISRNRSCDIDDDIMLNIGGSDHSQKLDAPLKKYPLGGAASSRGSNSNSTSKNNRWLMDDKPLLKALPSRLLSTESMIDDDYDKSTALLPA